MEQLSEETEVKKRKLSRKSRKSRKSVPHKIRERYDEFLNKIMHSETFLPTENIGDVMAFLGQEEIKRIKERPQLKVIPKMIDENIIQIDKLKRHNNQLRKKEICSYENDTLNLILFKRFLNFFKFKNNINLLFIYTR